MFRTSDATALFKVHRSTVSNWCDEYRDFLSDDANPTDGGHRRFSQEDMQILSLVWQKKTQGFTHEAIRAMLRNGDRGRIPDNSGLIPAEGQIVLMQARLLDLETRLMKTERERDEALSRLTKLHDENVELKAEAKRAERLEQEIRDLYKEIGRLSR